MTNPAQPNADEPNLIPLPAQTAQVGNAPSRPIPDDIADRMNAWLYWHRRWQQIHFIIGGASTLLAVVVASKPAALEPYNSTLTLAVAVCAATVTFFKTSSKASAFITAWRIMDAACDDFRSDPTFTEAQLRKAKKTGEDIISKSD